MKTPVPVILVLSLLIITLPSCQKFIDKQKEKMAMNIITNGQWYVEQYFEDANNVTSDFLNYEFQFKEDRTVTGTRGAESHAGTWTEDVATLSITSQFPTAPAPLTRLNGIWKFKDSTPEYVKAEMTTATGKNVLHLRKKP
jgi:type II secretory pathway pseudopilin PulG